MRLLVTSLILLAIFGLSFAGEFEDLKKETRFLESEFKLARADNIYFVFDLKQRQIYLKAKGIAYREFPVEGLKLWGREYRPEPHELLKRSALFKPKREKIKPPPKEETAVSNETGEDAEEEEETAPAGTFELEALELKDMPRNYSLTLDGGIVISVRPAPEGRVMRYVGEALFQINWHLTKPFVTIWHAIRKQPYSAIAVKLKDEDARAIYWSFSEGTKGLIYYP